MKPMKRGAMASVIAGALILIPFAETSAMSMPILPAAEDLAGDWRLHWSGGDCIVSLGARTVPMPRPAADAWTLTLAPDCVGTDAMEAIRAWRPASDGVAMVDAQGRTRLFLSRTEPGAYEAALPSGQRLRLTRD